MYAVCLTVNLKYRIFASVVLPTSKQCNKSAMNKNSHNFKDKKKLIFH